MYVLGTISFVTVTASPPCFGSKMIFTLKLMTWTCKEPLMITQVVRIHQRPLKEQWSLVSHTNPDVFENAYFIRICDRSAGKRFPNNTVSASGFFRELKQRTRRRRRPRERQTSKGLEKQNNNFARASGFFVHFFAVVARLRHESTVPNFTFWGGREHKTTIFFFFSWTSMQSFRIHLQKRSPTFVELNEVK